MKVELNTSNPGKQREYKRIFNENNIDISFTNEDLKEIDSDPVNVVVHKASQLPNILVDDTSLNIEGIDIGVNVRWMLDNIPSLKGKRANHRVLLAIMFDKGNEGEEESEEEGDGAVHIYEGIVYGTIVDSSTGKCDVGFGFDHVFQPDGSQYTMAESKPNKFKRKSSSDRKLYKSH